MMPSVGVPSVHSSLAMSTPSTDTSSQPIAIELSSCNPMSDRAAYAHILLVKTEDAPRKFPRPSTESMDFIAALLKLPYLMYTVSLIYVAGLF